MSHSYLQFAIPAFFILIFIEASYSHIKQLPLYNLRNSLSSLSCGLFTAGLEVFLKAALLGIYSWSYQHFALWEWNQNHWSTWLACLVVFDFLWYWAHRFSHEINFFWGGHVPHHQSEEFNLSTGLRQGALQDLMYWPFYLLMAPLGFSTELFISHVLINKFYGFWLHTQTIDKLPLLEGIFSTPSAHRVHHGMNAAYINKNYGGILILFDRLFGTYQREEEEVIYGVKKRFTSYHPIWAHFEWLHGLWLDARHCHNKWDALRIWLMPTGWRPPDLEQKDPRPSLKLSNYRKFDPSPRDYQTSAMLGLFCLAAALGYVLIVPPVALDWMQKVALFTCMSLVLQGLGRTLNTSLAQQKTALSTPNLTLQNKQSNN